MKRTFAALALFLALVPAAARGQSSIIAQIAGDKAATPKLFFSLKFGLNFSHLTADDDLRHTGGVSFGLSATIRLGDRFSLVPEITPFLRRGVSDVPLGTTGDPGLDPFFADLASSELALDYLDIPILVTYRLGRLHLGAGPYVALLSTAREIFRSVPATGESLRFSRDVASQYKKTDAGLAVEASWTIAKPRRGMGLIFHVRYEAGFLNVRAAPTASGSGRNSVIQVFLSFPFVL